jgi:hypothetical protein
MCTAVPKSKIHNTFQAIHKYPPLRLPEGLRVNHFDRPLRVDRLAETDARIDICPTAVSRCSTNSLKGKGNFIAEAALLYLPMTALW